MSVAWRDSFMTWPSAKVTIQLCPWAWRVRWYWDTCGGVSASLQLGPLDFDVAWNRRPFELERVGGNPGCGRTAPHLQHLFGDARHLWCRGVADSIGTAKET